MAEGSLSDQALYCVMNHSDLFHEYRCEETDGFPSELYLRLHISHLSEAFKTGQNAMEIKMILKNKQFGDGGKESPCLRLECAFASAASKQKTTIHDIKVELIGQKEWHLFQEPSMPQLDASVVLPDLKKIKVAVERLKNMSTQLKIAANSQGDMFLKIETDEISVKMSFKDVESIKCKEFLSDSTNDPGDMKEVTVDIKKFLQILQSSFEPTRAICNIVADRALQVFLCLDDQVALQYLVPAILP
ncbi:Checkpoint protein HUS1 isoform X1 [Oopsacas minuta]|uniref:Checkpoint protein n=1 Tax=Oopsacas minuta TaxID=111878 RepID=A0AAV7JWE4_9METZ|nr:Checkpoint protein HUS1 isoform X1 [Oopsacas minuta]